MKNILKRILVFSIALLLSMSNTNGFEMVNALNEVNIPQINKDIEIYSIKTKEQVIANTNIVEFYEVDPNKEEFLAYKAEQERLEQERLAKLELRNNIINYGKKFIGNPYVNGGNSLTNGTDCSGFVKYVYAKYEIELPRTSYEQSNIGNEVSLEEIEVGDIISYGYNGNVTHSALYIGDGKIVHAATAELGIMVDSMYIMPIITIRSVI